MKMAKGPRDVGGVLIASATDPILPQSRNLD